jgi:hypothetical protein
LHLVLFLFVSGLVVLFAYMIYLWLSLTRDSVNQNEDSWVSQDIAPMGLAAKPAQYTQIHSNANGMRCIAIWQEELRTYKRALTGLANMWSLSCVEVRTRAIVTLTNWAPSSRRT